ncbi:Secreted protein [Phytophthora megakarya]|uniref:Secreted protein n=1 Tax=Phytophthora megakarya TaxID=4795 RepID=A0A225V1I9_9STRA|nr:Secreted protein [Phytophthora megakarya]
MSELARSSGSTLPAFVEVIRVQTVEDYRSNKNLVLSVLKKLCSGPTPEETSDPAGAAIKSRLASRSDQYPSQKYSEGTRYVTIPGLDADPIEQWPELVVSLFGVVHNSNEDASTGGRTTHDISHPEDEFVNDYTDQPSIIKPDYVHCDYVATEILRVKREHLNAEVDVMATWRLHF